MKRTSWRGRPRVGARPALPHAQTVVPSGATGVSAGIAGLTAALMALTLTTPVARERRSGEHRIGTP